MKIKFKNKENGFGFVLVFLAFVVGPFVLAGAAVLLVYLLMTNTPPKKNVEILPPGEIVNWRQGIRPTPYFFDEEVSDPTKSE